MVKKKITMTEGKKNIIAALLQEYDIQTAEDIQDGMATLFRTKIYRLCTLNSFGLRYPKEL